MTVTGVEWRDPDAHDERFRSKKPPVHASKPVDEPDDDVVEIHAEAAEEAADGLDEFG
jgi:hypothetical protein